MHIKLANSIIPVLGVKFVSPVKYTRRLDDNATEAIKKMIDCLTKSYSQAINHFSFVSWVIGEELFHEPSVFVGFV